MNEKYNPASLRAGYRAMQYILLIYLYHIESVFS